MGKIPIKFKRVAAAFDEAVKWRGPCESSSGSEHWPDSGPSLSGLVNSFIEKGDAFYDMDTDLYEFEVDDNNTKEEDYCESENNKEEDCESENDDFNERKECLRGLLLECTTDNKNGVKPKILHHIEDALLKLQGSHDYDDDDDTTAGTSTSSGLKRNLMSHLRDMGFDAGLCKSRWDKTPRFPAGTYEYIDVNFGKTRYIVEVNMGGELDVVRPTARYKTLLDMIPTIVIIEKAQVLKQILRLMSGAMKESLKHAHMFVAPWRRNGYLQARYFSPYKRTIRPESSSSSSGLGVADLVRQQLTNNDKGSMVGFEAIDLPRSGLSYNCRDHSFVSKAGVRVGLLSAALQGI